MNCPDCDRPVHGQTCSCGWSALGQSKIIYRSTEHERPANGVSREVFGETLYEILFAIGELKQVRKNRSRYGELVSGPTSGVQYACEQKLVDKVRSAMIQLTPEEVVQVTDKYPWVAEL